MTIRVNEYLDRVKELQGRKTGELQKLRALEELNVIELIQGAIGDFDGKKFSKHFQNRLDKATENVEGLRRVMLREESFFSNLKVFIFFEYQGRTSRKEYSIYNVLDDSRNVNVPELLESLDLHLKGEIEREEKVTQELDFSHLEKKLEEANELIAKLSETLGEITQDGNGEMVDILRNTSFANSMIRHIV